MKIFPLAILLACNSDNQDSSLVEVRRDTEVRVVSPTNGETVESTFTIRYETGESVKKVILEVDDSLIKETTSVEGKLVVTLDSGRHQLALIGTDKKGNELSRHELMIRVAEENESWVTITSPPDGANVYNPVYFVVDAPNDVDSVKLLADDWPLGEVKPGNMLTYNFSGTGYERNIVAEAYSNGTLVASDSITITVLDGTNPDKSDFNDLAVNILESYPTDGTHDYLWNESYYGTTRDLYYLGEQISWGNSAQNCYCSGITWELFIRTFESLEPSMLNGLSVDEMDEFRRDWYVRDLFGSGVVEALENYGVGEEVTNLEHLRPGDFVQIWRNSGSGHSVVFVDWETDSLDNIIGIYYWSCQGSTDGIGYNSEYFGSSSSNMDPAFFYAARAWMPDEWLPWSKLFN